MDRLTTGRRHLRAGSVTVTELLSRQASPTHCTESSPAAQDSAQDHDVADDITDTIPVVVPEALRREPVRGAQLAKLASLGVAGVVLCGAVTIASMIAHQRRENGHTAMRPSVQITGEQALLPDRLDETVPKAPTTAPAPASNIPLAVEDEPAPDAAPAAPLDHSGTAASGGAVTVGPATDLDLVREFYEKLPESPVAAFNLLASNVIDTSLEDFLTSWSTVIAVDSVDVTHHPDGVLATVRIRLADGDQLRVQQLLTVAESPRRIVGVQLLSAQRN